MDVLLNYLETNRKRLLVYTGFYVLFFVVNYLFFRDNIDAPVDLIFTMVFVAFAPSIIVGINLLRSVVLLEGNKIVTFGIHLIAPFIISFVFTMIYWVVEMQDSATLFEIMIVHFASLPMMFFAVIVVLIWKHTVYNTITLLGKGVVVVIFYWLILLGLGMLENQIEDSVFTNIGYVVLFFIIPFGYMSYLINGLKTT